MFIDFLREHLIKSYNHDMTKIPYWVGIDHHGHAHIFKEQEPLHEHYKKMYSKVKGPISSREKALQLKHKFHNPLKHVANLEESTMQEVHARLKGYLEESGDKDHTWFNTLNKNQKHHYINMHPKSKLAQTYKKSEKIKTFSTKKHKLHHLVNQFLGGANATVYHSRYKDGGGRLKWFRQGLSPQKVKQLHQHLKKNGVEPTKISHVTRSDRPISGKSLVIYTPEHFYQKKRKKKTT